MLTGLNRSGDRSGTDAVSIGNNYNMQGEQSLAERYSRLAQETPRRRVDFEVRALDVIFSILFLVVVFPIAAMIGIGILLTSGRPAFYRGERVGRGGRIFTMTKFRTLSTSARKSGSGITSAWRSSSGRRRR